MTDLGRNIQPSKANHDFKSNLKPKAGKRKCCIAKRQLLAEGLKCFKVLYLYLLKWPC